MATQHQSTARGGYHDLIRHDAIAWVPRDAGGTLLDVGGGVGATANRIRELGYVERVGVIDLVHPDPALVDFSYTGNLEDPATIKQVVAEQGPFNVVLCLDVLEHLVDPWSVIKRLHEGLAPNGVIVASIPNVRCLEVVYPLLVRGTWELRDEGILDRTHLRFFVRQTAIDLMRSSGLKIEKVEPLVHPGKNYQRLRKLAFGLANTLTDRQYLIVARNAA